MTKERPQITDESIISHFTTDAWSKDTNAVEEDYKVEEQGFGEILEYLEKENKAAEKEEKELLLNFNSQK